MPGPCIIVGAGQAGGQCAASLRQFGYEGEIILIGAETEPPYERPPLSKAYLAGEIEKEKLYLRNPDFYAERDITLRTGVTVEDVDPERRLVTLDSANQLEFEYLVLATGTAARPLPIPGHDVTGIHLLRSLADVTAIKSELTRETKLAIVGAGYIGLEVAAVATKLGLKPVVVERENRVMARTSSPEISKFYEDQHRAAGVDFKFGVSVSDITGVNHLDGLICSDATSVPATMAIVGIGVVPCTGLATDAGLEVNNGIVVDETCQTSHARIWAIGDCTNHPNAILGRRMRLESVQNAMSQGKTAASAICGDPKPYKEVPWFWSDQFDLKLQIAGVPDPSDHRVVRGNPADRSFSVVWMRDGVVTGCESVNRPKDFLQSKKLIESGVNVEPDAVQDPEMPLKSLL